MVLVAKFKEYPEDIVLVVLSRSRKEQPRLIGHQFADDKPKCTYEYEPNLALFQDFEALFGSQDPDPHLSER